MIDIPFRYLYLGSRKPVYHTSWEVVVTLTDRPKSVRNRCVIEDFGGVFVLPCCFSDFSVGVGAFIIRLSHISSFSLEVIHTNCVLIFLLKKDSKMLQNRI